MARAPQPDDLYRLRIPTDPQLAPGGDRIAFTVQTVAPTRDGYRHAIWSTPFDGSTSAERLTIGSKHDRTPRFAPDGRSLAFLSDRRIAVEEEPAALKDREDAVQVHLLPLDRPGEARRLTNLPRGVEEYAWSPDGGRLAVVSSSHGATVAEDLRRRGRPAKAPEAGDPPASDFHFIDRLRSMSNGAGWVYHKVTRLWVVDIATGSATLVHAGRAPVSEPAWSADGSRIAFSADRGRDDDLGLHSDVWVVAATGGRAVRVTGGGGALGGRGFFSSPAWLPDGAALAVLGHRWGAGAGTRADVWLMAADGSDAGPHAGRNLTAGADLVIDSGMGSDVTIGESNRIAIAPDGRSVYFSAPVDGSFELWRVPVDGGAVVRLTTGQHYYSSFAIGAGPHGAVRVAAVWSTPTDLPEVVALELPVGRLRTPLEQHAVTDLNREVREDVALVKPETRWTEVDGRRIQGWYYPPNPITPAGPGDSQSSSDAATLVTGRRRRRGSPGPAPLVVEIHGGPHTLYGWSPFWEWQVLAGAGIGVWAANPRGSQGYGEAFNGANFRDWGPGPMRDILAGVDGLIAEDRADPDRLGVTGGSYGGYLTSWIVGHTDRFRAAITCRSVNDLISQMSTGDIAGPSFGRLEFGATPWEDPDLYREHSPLTYARRIQTPLLIQHAERDLRTPIGQAEELFTVLRSLRRPVRMMRVPDESHELTRSGTPFRRVENAAQIRAWFEHFLIRGRRDLPPLPRNRAGL
jgi:dipeptidyl aminopeptidase/acylaminoacyl peptidase